MRIASKFKLALTACVIVAFAAYLPGLANDPVTDADCEDAWENSDAADNCGYAYSNPDGWGGWLITTSYYWAKAAGGQNCNIEVDCARDDDMDQPIENDIVVGHSTVTDLKNCDGTLKIGNC